MWKVLKGSFAPPMNYADCKGLPENFFLSHKRQYLKLSRDERIAVDEYKEKFLLSLRLRGENISACVFSFHNLSQESQERVVSCNQAWVMSMVPYAVVKPDEKHPISEGETDKWLACGLAFRRTFEKREKFLLKWLTRLGQKEQTIYALLFP